MRTKPKAGSISCRPRFATPRDPRETLGPAVGEIARRLGLPLMPWQQEVIDVALELDPDGSYHYDEVDLTVPRQSGKGLSEDTLLPTPEGWVRMGDVRVGATLFDEAGAPTTVTFVSEKRWLDCYRVHFSDGTSVVADGDHLWTVFDIWRHEPGAGRNGGKGRWLTLSTREMVGKSMVGTRGKKESRYRLPAAGPLRCADAELPIDPWLLGAWLGDGTSRGSELTVGSRDIDEMRRCIEATGASTRLRQDPRTRAWTVRFNIGAATRDGFESRARRLDVWGDKHIPDVYLRASVEQRLALLQGLMDTDGTVRPNGTNRRARQCVFLVTNERLAKGCVELVRSLGIRASIKEGLARLNGRDIGPKWTVSFTTDLSVFRLSRKADIHGAQQLPLRTRARTIHDIVAVPTVPTRCIQVDSPNSLFRCGEGMVPTHNTALILAMLVHRLTKVARDLGRQRVTYTAQQRQKARNKLERDFAQILRDARAFNEILHIRDKPQKVTEWKLSLNNGAENIQFGRGNYLQIDAPSWTAGHSDTLDVGVIDEAFAREDDTLETGLSATMITRRNRQLWVVSTAGDARSMYLYRKVLAGRKACKTGNHARTAYFEWSAEDDADPADPSTWRSCMPALGFTVTERTIEGEWEKALRGGEDGVKQFRRSFLNQWPDVPVLDEVAAPKALDVALWVRSVDHDADRGSPVVFGVDVDAARLAHVAVAWRRDDERIHVMLAATGVSPLQTPSRVAELAAKWKGRVMLGGTSSSLEGEVRNASVVSGSDFASAYGRFDDLLRGDQLRHGNQPELNVAVDTAKTRAYGTAGERSLQLGASPEVGPLAAVVRAIHGLLIQPRHAPAAPAIEATSRSSTRTSTDDLSSIAF